MSCSDVCVSVYMDDFMEFYREATRHAAKAYRCCECGDPIAKGESHHYACGKADGVFVDYRTCAGCAEIRKALCCGGFVFEQLWEDINEQFFPEWYRLATIDCVARLSDAAQAKLQARHATYLEDRA